MINGGKGLPQQFQLKINTQFHLDLETMPHYPLAVKMLKINLLTWNMAILKRQNKIFWYVFALGWGVALKYVYFAKQFFLGGFWHYMRIGQQADAATGGKEEDSLNLFL